MSRPVSNTKKTSRVRVKQKNGDIYVLERTTIYDPEKGYTRSLGTKLIGKIPKGQQEMVPTRPRQQPAARPEQKAEMKAERKRVGLVQILQWIGKQSGIDADLYASTDEGTASKILTLVYYWLSSGGRTLPHLETWQLSHQTPYEEGMSESIYHRLFKDLGRDEDTKQKYFRRRAARLDQSPSVAFDSTTISTYSRQIHEARQGFNKAADGLDTVKLLTFYSVKTHQPIAYAKQPGNLPDVTSISSALKQLDCLRLRRPLIVTDNGYYSQSNITDFTRNHTQFLTLGNMDVTWIQKQFLAHREQLFSVRTICPWDHSIHGLTVPVKHDISWQRQRSRGGIKAGETVQEQHRYYLHFFLNRNNAAKDETRFVDKLLELKDQVENNQTLTEGAQKQVEKYLIVKRRGKTVAVDFNDQAIKEAGQKYGYFVLVTNKAMDCFEALGTYRMRERIEEAFKVHKDRLDGTRTRVWSGDNLDGRMFVQFVGLGYYSFIMSRINQLKDTLGKDEGLTKEQKKEEDGLKRWLEQHSLGQILDWFDCVEETTVETKAGKARWSSGSTKRDRLFLSKLGVI